MSISTKTARVFQASNTNAAGATKTGTTVNLTSALGCTITAKIVNGATGPTIPCTFYVDVSSDNSNWFVYSQESAGTTLGTTYYMQPVVLPSDVMYARTRFTGNTAQTVTVEAQGQELTSVS